MTRPTPHLDSLRAQLREAQQAHASLGMALAVTSWLLEEAMHLCKHGEEAPGGGETWAGWYRRAEHHLRWGGPGVDVPQVGANTERATSYPPVQVPENTGKHQDESEPIGSNADIFCRDPSCPDYGDPDFGEATCPAEHADPNRWGCITP